MTPKEPLSPTEARGPIQRAVATGLVRFSRHALDEMTKDDMDRDDVLTVLRGGVVRPGEPTPRGYTYRVEVSWACAVVAFKAEDGVLVVTAWKVNP